LKPLRLIVNANAGGGRAGKILPQARAELTRLGAQHAVEMTRSPDHARELAREAAQAGEVAVAMGGDGLIGVVAEGLLDMPGAVLGVIAAGRGNDLARKLAIPTEVKAACETLVGGEPRPIDVAGIDSRAYLGIASIGIDSDVQVIANASRLRLGGSIYAYATLRALATWKAARFDVVVDGREMTFNGFSVAVANSGVFGGGMYLSPDSRIDDGVLEVVASEGTSKLRYAAMLPRVFKGAHVDDPDVHILTAREVMLDADRPFKVFADGDPIADLPATVKVLPHAVRVLVPPGP
jgi:YegS/Rv2252/BmrU family lipid kinase